MATALMITTPDPTSNMGDHIDQPQEALDQPSVEFDRGDQPFLQEDPLDDGNMPRGRGDQPNQQIEDQSTQTEATEEESQEEEAREESCGHIGRYCIVHRKCDLCKVGDPAECPDCRDDDYDSDPHARPARTIRAKSDLDSYTILPHSDPVTTKASVCVQADSRGKDVSTAAPQATEQADSKVQELPTGGPQDTESEQAEPREKEVSAVGPQETEQADSKVQEVPTGGPHDTESEQADPKVQELSTGGPQDTESEQADSRGKEVSTVGPRETENSQVSEKTKDTEDGHAVNESTPSTNSKTENLQEREEYTEESGSGLNGDIVNDSPSPITISSESPITISSESPITIPSTSPTPASPTSNYSNSETIQVGEGLVKEETKANFEEKKTIKRSYADDIKLLPPQVQQIIPVVTGQYLVAMGDLTDKVQLLLTENAELKLQLNAIQQAKAALELEIGKKDEIILKTEAEALKNEQLFKQDVKHLREQLKENSKTIEKDDYKELEEQMKLSKAREAKALAEVAQKITKEAEMQATMDNYVATIKANTLQIQQLDQELTSTKTHLANLELAFSDVHHKYEKTKESLKVRTTNEDNLNSQIAVMRQTRLQDEERYEALKAHAHAQIDKANRENMNLRNESEDRLAKLNTIIKRFDIKVKSLEQSLQQKVTECEALASLCDEVTGKKNARTVH